MAKQSDGVKKQPDSHSGGDQIDYPGIDNPGNTSTEKGKVGQSSSQGQKALEGGKSIINNQIALEQEAPKITAQDDIPYGNPPAVENDAGMKLSDVNDKFAPNKDIATIAANNNASKLPELVQQVDPDGKMQKLPQMFQKLQQARDILNFAGGAGGGGGGSGGGGGGGSGGSDYTAGSSESLVTESFGEALCYLSSKLGFPLVIEVMYNAVKGNLINVMSPDHQKQTRNAVAILLDRAVKYGPDNLPLYRYETIDFGDKIPPYPLTSYAQVPDLYVRVYYNSPDVDPYPGWLQYNAQPPQFANTSIQSNISGYAETVWVKRKSNQTAFYSSASEELYSTATLDLAARLEPYFINRTLTAAIIDANLATINVTVQATGQDLSLGKGAGNNGGNNSNMQQFIQQLMQMMQMFQQNDLANGSVLDSNSIKKTTEDYQKNMGPLGKITQQANGAFGANQFMNLGNIQSMTGQLGKFGSKSGGGGKNQGSGGNYNQPQSTGNLKGTFAANSYNTDKTLTNVSGLMSSLGAPATSNNVIGVS